MAKHSPESVCLTADAGFHAWPATCLFKREGPDFVPNPSSCACPLFPSLLPSIFSSPKCVNLAICLGYKGREGWADIGGSAGPKCESKPFLMPTLPEGFEIRFTDRRGVAGVESVFGGAFCPGLPPPPCQPYRVMSPRHRPTEVGVEAPLHSKACPSTTSTNSTKSGRRAIPGSDAGDADSGDEGNPCAAPEPEQARAEVPPTSPDRYFVAYGHCLLAGAGTGVSDEARERAAETNGFCGTAGSNGRPPFLGADAAARISDKKRTQGYGDALEVFQEGLRRFPTSAALLYGSSFAMQASPSTGAGDRKDRGTHHVAKPSRCQTAPSNPKLFRGCHSWRSRLRRQN